MQLGLETVISLFALVVSAIALISGFISNKYQSISVNDQVYERFAQMWFDMDEVFLKHPRMHKYFYRLEETGEYAVLQPDDVDFELGVCIAEMFQDVFQYSKPLEQYLSEEDRASYLDYKKMITEAPIVKVAHERHNWHKNEEERLIGQAKETDK